MKAPSFQADPNHRVKVIGKHFFALAKLPKKSSSVTKADTQRLKEYAGKMLAQQKHLDPKKDEALIVNNVNAIIEHIFDNHSFCGGWCYKKKAQAENKHYTPPSNRPFYCKKKIKRSTNNCQM